MYDEHRKLTYNQVIARDEKRFKVADRDGDQKLGREEYADFLHPGKVAPQRPLLIFMAMMLVCVCTLLTCATIVSLHALCMLSKVTLCF